MKSPRMTDANETATYLLLFFFLLIFWNVKQIRYTVFSAKQVLFAVAIYKEKVATIDLNVYWPGE